MDYNAVEQLERLGDFKALTQQNNTPKKIMALVKAGADVNARDEYDRTPLIIVINNFKIARLLIHYGADISLVDDFDRNALYYAKSKEMTEFLLICGCDINSRDIYEYTPLLYLILHKKTTEDHIMTLLLAGADINAVDYLGRSILHRAISVLNIEKIKLLIEAGADVNAVDYGGKSVLHRIIDVRKREFLIQNGAIEDENIDIENED